MSAGPPSTMSAFIPCVGAPFLARAVPRSLTSARARLPRSPPRRARLAPVCATPAEDADADASTDAAAAAPTGEVPFEIRGFSLANLGLFLGIAITAYSFSSYFGSNGTSSASSLGFVYGVPILLIGCALKYAELQPIAVTSTPDARAAREEKATEVQRKIYSDITRHRYGDEAHLQAALAALGLIPRGEPCPELRSGEESVTKDGEYCIRLTFYSVATPWKEWSGKIDKYERFFGPGVVADVEKVDSEKRLVALSLRTGERAPEAPEAPGSKAQAQAETPAGER